MNPAFRYTHYRQMTHALKDGRDIVGYEEAAAANADAPIALLRHDIDICLDAALAIAEIEAEEGVTATYFLRLNGTFYNPLSRRGAPIVQRILELGHDIGLHFDVEHYRAIGVDDRSGILAEIGILEAAFDAKVWAFSQHRPFVLGQSPIKDDPDLAPRFAYAPCFTETMKYISDSGQNWREGDVLSHLHEPRLHVLTHPIWWSEDGAPWQDLLRAAAAREAAAMTDKADILVERYAAYLENRDKGNAA